MRPILTTTTRDVLPHEHRFSDNDCDNDEGEEEADEEASLRMLPIGSQLPREEKQITNRSRSKLDQWRGVPFSPRLLHYVATLCLAASLLGIVVFRPGTSRVAVSPASHSLNSLATLIDRVSSIAVQHNDYSKHTLALANSLGIPLNDPNLLYPEPLGKQVCILDVDTRPWRVADGLDGGDEEQAQAQAAYGRLNHYLYAKLHNYTYHFIHAPPATVSSPTHAPLSLHPTWSKINGIRSALALPSSPNFVVFLDSDAIFPHLSLPLEPLLSHWNITPSRTAIAAALAPDEPEKYDSHGRRNVNTGFMIVQQTPLTEALLREWAECPSEIKYPGCARWADPSAFWHEQSAYSEYIRHDAAYAREGVLKEIKCDEANGAPENWLRGGKQCRGTLVRHYWVCKQCVRKAVEHSVVDLVVGAGEEGLGRDWEGILVDEAL